MAEHRPIAEGALRLPPLDARTGPAARISEAKAAALIEGAVGAWLAGTPSLPPPPLATGAGRLALGWAAGGLAALLLASGATVLLFAADGAPAATPAPHVGAKPTAPAATPHVGAPADPTPHVGAPAADPAAADRRAAPAAIDPAAPARRARAASPAPAAAPEDLLRQANALRGARRYREAESLYATAARRSGPGLTGYVANVAAGSLRLEHLGDPTGAVAAFEAALAAQPSGPLDLEIRRGLAGAWHRLGQPTREAAALRALLARHPAGPAADEARARLAAIE